MSFDPNAPALPDAGIFGLPTTYEEARVVYLPVPWEATTSYGGGTSEGPNAIFNASHQVDLFDLEVEKPYEPGLYMVPLSEEVAEWNVRAKESATYVLDHLGVDSKEVDEAIASVNHASQKVNDYVKHETERLLRDGKIVALIGGDHSVPLGAFQAIGAHAGDFGVLHIDAHSDTRKAYEGFTYSHASIMYNACEEVPQLKKLVQVGIRDFCEEEFEYIKSSGDRISTFFDVRLQQAKLKGKPFTETAAQIVGQLPKKVWISFDIDGLDPRYCPHTGTPVPGGLELAEVLALFREIVVSGREIIGFDLNEVAPNLNDPSDEWDANVGARILYKMTAYTLASKKLCAFSPE